MRSYTVDDVDARIAHTDDPDTLRKPKAQRSALTRLCKLPEELLVQIISLVQTRSLKIDLFRPEAFQFPDHRWSWIMLICTRMRSVAMNAGALWSFANYRAHPAWHYLCLSRRVNAPLRLALDFQMAEKNSSPRGIPIDWDEPEKRTVAIASAAEVLARSSALVCNHGHTSIDQQFALAREQPAPFLDHLSICATMCLSHRLLAGKCSSIRSLSLVGLKGMEGIPPDFRALECFELETAHLDTGQGFGWVNTLLWLRRMPTLEELVLAKNTTPITRYPATEEQELLAAPTHADLPRLQCLRRKDCQERILKLLRSLPQPAQSIHIEIYHAKRSAWTHMGTYPVNLDDEVADVLTWLRTWW